MTLFKIMEGQLHLYQDPAPHKLRISDFLIPLNGVFNYDNRNGCPGLENSPLEYRSRRSRLVKFQMVYINSILAGACLGAAHLGANLDSVVEGVKSLF
jgi:hypothetical protein